MREKGVAMGVEGGVINSKAEMGGASRFGKDVAPKFEAPPGSRRNKFT